MRGNFEKWGSVTIIVCDASGTPSEAYKDNLNHVYGKKLKLFTQDEIYWSLSRDGTKAYAWMDIDIDPLMYVEPWAEWHDDLCHHTLQMSGKYLREKIKTPRMIARMEADAKAKIERNKRKEADKKRAEKKRLKRPAQTNSFWEKHWARIAKRDERRAAKKIEKETNDDL